VIWDLLENGLRQHQAGRLEEAKRLYQQVLESDPAHPDALHLLGVAVLQSGNADSAIGLLEKAVQAKPRNAAFHSDLAQAYLALRRAADAQGAFQRAARLDPHNPQFAVDAAVCLALQGRARDAEQQLRGVAQRHPGFAMAWFNLGNVLREQGRAEEAADAYRRVIRLDPAFADAYGSLGSVLHERDQFEDAEQAYRQHLALQPDAPAGCFNLASLLNDLGRPAEAVMLCRRGIERARGSAVLPELQRMLGSALAQLGQYTSALLAFRAAAAMAPGNARALWGYGVALLQTGDPEEGLRWLERVRELEPDRPEFHHAMASVCLSLGDQQTGWQEYEWRSARRGFVEKYSPLRLLTEVPADLSGKRICLLREQGLGDELFFLRFAPGLKSRGATITYRADAKLASLLERVPALDQVLTEEEPLPAADLSVLAGDLPRLLERLDSVPYRPAAALPRNLETPVKREARLAHLPRVFYPEPPPPLALAALPRQLRDMERRLGELGPPPHLGLTWRAGTAPEQQRGSIWMLHKETPRQRLGTAVRGVNCTLLALQRNAHPGEIEELSAQAGRPVHDLTALNEDLEAMLALLTLIDDYVGVSNTNMHLRAGAGRTARVLVPRPAEWRWLIAGEESPWFPGFRIYRQRPDGDWGAAFERLARDLRTETGKH
jgi:tetratricopeptide (TPR) repeat protein